MFNLQSIFKEVSLSRFNIYLALWLAVVLNVMFYKQVQLLTPYHDFKAYAFIGATILVVLAFYHLVFQLLQWRPMAKGLAALLIIIGGMSAYFVNSLGVSITPDQIQNMMQTDGNEVRDLLSWRLVLWIGAMVVLPLVVLFKVKIRRDPFKTVLLHKLFGSAVSIVAALPCGRHHRLTTNSPLYGSNWSFSTKARLGLSRTESPLCQRHHHRGVCDLFAEMARFI
jgi:lipid A ethanolaminephosphotransferase